MRASDMDTHKAPAPCRTPGCREAALSLSEYCWSHLTDHDRYTAELVAYAGSHQDLKGFNLKKSSFEHASFMNVDLSEADLSQATFSCANFHGANFERANLVGTQLSGSDLANASFNGADLTRADLGGCRLWHCDFTLANLTETNVSNADLWNACLYDVKLWHTLLTDASFLSSRSFAPTSGSRAFRDTSRINERGILSAEVAYRDIKNYFLSHGMYTDAGWASYKEKTMERFILKQNREIGYLWSLIMNILCGYGERPFRIVSSALITIILYASVFFILNGITSPPFPGMKLTFIDYLYQSTITYATVGYGDLVPKPTALFRLLAASEAFFGVFLNGLFVFTLARRYSAR